VHCAQHLGYDLPQLASLALASFDAAFLPYRQKRALREAAAREITQLLADAPAITEAA
jgi:hypothetical protein